MEKKIIVGIFFGGISPEHEVSITSAQGVVSNIDNALFDTKQIFIDKLGKFWTGEEIIAKARSGSVAKMLPVKIDELSKMINVAFPVLHGVGGEDGSIQGFFQMLGIPYVGCGIAASAICLDKGVFNILMVANGIPKPEFIILDYQYDDEKTLKGKLKIAKTDFGFPVFIKPARLGSSVGILKVKHTAGLQKAIEKAKKFDTKIIVEKSIEDCQEIEVSVLGNHLKGIQVSMPGRVVPGAEFYDYDDKYKSDMAKFEVPAKLAQEKINEIQSIAKRAYMIAGCTGLSRVDFLLDDQEKVFLNEINTLPGFTPISMYPRLWQATGLSYKDLLTKLIYLALHQPTI